MISELLQNEVLLHESPPILETIYNTYFETQGYPEGIIREYYQEFDRLSEQLLPTQKDSIHNTVADLCTEYEKKGFIDGLKTGACIILELIK